VPLPPLVSTMNTVDASGALMIRVGPMRAMLLVITALLNGL
jgi:hypothetical protein